MAWGLRQLQDGLRQDHKGQRRPDPSTPSGQSLQESQQIHQVPPQPREDGTGYPIKGKARPKGADFQDSQEQEA